MTKKSMPAVFTVDQVTAVFKARSTLRLVIRGHQCVESALNRAIAESLAHSHVLEIKRMQFSLKVDLAIALGLVELEARPAFKKLNTIRNRFAHDPDSRLTKAEAMQLYHALSPGQRQALKVDDPNTYFKNAAHAFRESFATIFFSITSAVTRLIDDRMRQEEWSRIVQEKVGPRDSPEVIARTKKYGEPYRARVEERVRAQLGAIA
jgi:hypothetical protein